MDFNQIIVYDGGEKQYNLRQDVIGSQAACKDLCVVGRSGYIYSRKTPGLSKRTGFVFPGGEWNNIRSSLHGRDSLENCKTVLDLFFTRPGI